MLRQQLLDKKKSRSHPLFSLWVSSIHSLPTSIDEIRAPMEEIEEEREKTPSLEIIEEEEEEGVCGAGDTQRSEDVYVAVGKKDMGTLRWAVDRAAAAGARIFLVHIFPPINYIPTPVGMLARSQLSPEQVNLYTSEESNKRISLLQEYIHFCNNTKVNVDTVLVESNDIAKSILDLIPILNITTLVIGANRTSSSRRLRKGLGKGELIQKNAPESCNVLIVLNGNKVVHRHQASDPVSSSPLSALSDSKKSEISQSSERRLFDCACFTGKSS